MPRITLCTHFGFYKMGKRKHSETEDNLSTASTEILEELSDYGDISDQDMSFFGVEDIESKQKQLN